MSNFFSWETAWLAGVVLLGAAIAWGLLQYRTRTKANDRVTEEATRLMHEHSTERYMREDRPRLNQELRRK
jgi:hypothetical protein